MEEAESSVAKGQRRQDFAESENQGWSSDGD